MTTAVVFAYHNVGVRCLKVLLAHEVHIPLVVTHADDPAENRWFDSVAEVAADYDLRCIAPHDANDAAVVRAVVEAQPDFLFSFYYRRMLGAELVGAPSRGALNMHGSLLPQYRGRAPVNWAVLRGERQTGATLHYMAGKPDAGDIVAQQAVPILPDDTAKQVFDKVTVAAEIALDAVLPALIAGTAPRRHNDIASGSYFGGRRPEDGRIDWSQSAMDVHNLVRAVAPPYPGAFTNIAGRPARVLASRVLDQGHERQTPRLDWSGEVLRARCGGGGTLAIRALEVDGVPIDRATFIRRFGATVDL